MDQPHLSWTELRASEIWQADIKSWYILPIGVMDGVDGPKEKTDF